MRAELSAADREHLSDRFEKLAVAGVAETRPEDTTTITSTRSKEVVEALRAVPDRARIDPVGADSSQAGAQRPPASPHTQDRRQDRDHGL